MLDNQLWDTIRAIPQQTQRQYSTDEQLQYLMAAANKLGLYDAADRLRNDLEMVDASSPTPEQLHDLGVTACTFPCEICASRNSNYLTQNAEKLREDWRDRRAARDFGRN